MSHFWTLLAASGLAASGLAASGLGVVGITGCKASVQAEARTSGDAQASLDAELEQSEGRTGLAEQGAESAAASSEAIASQPGVALLGARPDLTLGQNGGDQACHCLSVRVGQPNDPTFVWQMGVPVIDPASEVIIAVSSAGTSCSQESGASYWGYEKSGNDVVVVVENARPGRPVIQGAIVPRPTGNGRIRIKPLDKQVRFGRSPDGAGGECALKSPGS